MKIRNIKHKGLKNFVTKGIGKGMPADKQAHIAQIVTYLAEIEEIEEFFALKKWRAHKLTGDRSNSYALSVSGNYRITFKYDAKENELYDLDYEDYH